MSAMNDPIEYEREEDGLWIAEGPQLPGGPAYGATAAVTTAKAEAPAQLVLAE